MEIILKDKFTCLLNESATAIFSLQMEILTVYLIFKIHIEYIQNLKVELIFSENIMEQ